MDVLLVNTNRMKPPIAPLAFDYLGGTLKTAGHRARLLDFGLAEDPAQAARRAFAGSRPDVVALTFRNSDDCYFASGASFVDVLRNDVELLRQHHDGPLLVGGGGFSVLPELLLDHAGADYGVVGDGETALLEFLRFRRGDIAAEAVPGLVHRRRGVWRRNPVRPADLAAPGLSARDTVDNAAYFRRGGQAGVETKRGCPGRCVYCADPPIKGRSVRRRRPDDVVSEVRNLLAQGIDHLHFCDSEFNLPADHAEDVCRALIDGGVAPKIRWFAYAAPQPFTPDFAALLRRAGCAGVNFGADSASDPMLKRLGRDHSADRLAETARLCRKNKITFMYDLLIGGPGETPDTARETLRAVQKMEVDRVGVAVGVRVYPGTPLAEQIKREPALRAGLRGDPESLAPAFYVSPALGADPFDLVRTLTGNDDRFLLPSGKDEKDYNYNDNTVLARAVEAGHRGAYWDILRRLKQGLPPGAVGRD
ncbi:MAG TPA: radical SAM protein [Elusimicrobiota bacterium]|nr:radical SAM protein [Elusimicrobiota bacterium]